MDNADDVGSDSFNTTYSTSNQNRKNWYITPLGDNKSSDNSSYLKFLAAYLKLRFVQLKIVLQLGSYLFYLSLIELKKWLVTKMYWGRSPIYKTLFHFIVVSMTLLALASGLTTRILSINSKQFSAISTSRFQVDSDLVSQEGDFFPISELNGETDSLYSDYIVKSGDTVSDLAAKFNLSADTIRWANNLSARQNNLVAGQVLLLPKINGVLYLVKQGDSIDSIFRKLVVDTNVITKEDFIELNSRAGYLTENNQLRVGTRVFIPDAKLSAPNVTRNTVKIPPVNLNNLPKGSFVNPMQLAGSYHISRGYKATPPRVHTGVDLAVNSGSVVVAAGSGQVLRAGYCGDLGYCVVIRHANGYSSLYGHGNGKMYVTPGQIVLAGQRIMLSGCTGNCGGPHVHLSLAANGQDVLSCYYCRINPLGIIPY